MNIDDLFYAMDFTTATGIVGLAMLAGWFVAWLKYDKSAHKFSRPKTLVAAFGHLMLIYAALFYVPGMLYPIPLIAYALSVFIMPYHIVTTDNATVRDTTRMRALYIKASLGLLCVVTFGLLFVPYVGMQWLSPALLVITTAWDITKERNGMGFTSVYHRVIRKR